MSRKEKALELFRSGYNCAQSVFAAYADTAGIPESQAKACACGFGAGIARTQSTCGALTGAVMALGAKHHSETHVAASKAIVYEKTAQFLGNFKEKHGSTGCLGLIGVDFSEPGAMDRVKAQDLFAKKCEAYIESACELLEEVL